MQFELLGCHDRANFDCGDDNINRYLWTMASQHHKKGVARVHILAQENTIIGFYTLTNLVLDNTDLCIEGYPKQIPAILIGRMGVDLRYQGRGFSKMLLSHALKKIKTIGLDTGVVFAVIDAKSDELAQYYTTFGFKQTNKPCRLILNLTNI